MAQVKKAPGAELAQSIPSKPSAEDQKYETNNHLNTLIDAHAIMSDPEKMKHVHKLAGRRHKAIKSLQDLKDRAADSFKPEQDNDE